MLENRPPEWLSYSKRHFKDQMICFQLPYFFRVSPRPPTRQDLLALPIMRYKNQVQSESTLQHTHSLKHLRSTLLHTARHTAWAAQETAVTRNRESEGQNVHMVILRLSTYRLPSNTDGTKKQKQSLVPHILVKKQSLARTSLAKVTPNSLPVKRRAQLWQRDTDAASSAVSLLKGKAHALWAAAHIWYSACAATMGNLGTHPACKVSTQQEHNEIIT